MGSFTTMSLVSMTWMKVGGACGLRVRDLTPSYSSRRGHMEMRGTSQVSYHYGACSRREGSLVLFSSHSGRRSVARAVPSHVPAEDGSTDNGLEGGSDQQMETTTRQVCHTKTKNMAKTHIQRLKRFCPPLVFANQVLKSSIGSRSAKKS